MSEDIARKIEELQATHTRLGDEIADARARLPDARRVDREIKRAREGAASAHVYYDYPDNEQRLRDSIDELVERRDVVGNELAALAAHHGNRRRSPASSTSVDDSPRLVGTVKWYNSTRGYGFIAVDGQPDVFVPAASLVEASSLTAGEVVSFKRTLSERGYQAVDVRTKPT